MGTSGIIVGGVLAISLTWFLIWFFKCRSAPSTPDLDSLVDPGEIFGMDWAPKRSNNTQNRSSSQKQYENFAFAMQETNQQQPMIPRAQLTQVSNNQPTQVQNQAQMTPQ